ncbi:hypothetical protein GF402_09525 [Candidatus Fermentibacteria bacterium]|nr:hypothetical protein [Candidatus Fermentibacteria bacterium]
MAIFPAAHNYERQEFTSQDREQLEVLEQVQQDLERDMDRVREAGCYEFLPRFTLNYSWVPRHVRSYAGMEEKEGAYLRVWSTLTRPRRDSP